MKEDFKRLIHGTAQQDVHRTALTFQAFDEGDIEAQARRVDPMNPDRQSIRRGLRWAVQATTEEVEDAIREVAHDTLQPIQPGDECWLEENDCFGTQILVTVVKVHGDNVLVDDHGSQRQCALKYLKKTD